MTLAIVGIVYENADGSSRRFELALCRAGDPVALVREPKNKYDPRAVAVFSERGVQLGYLSAERCGLIGKAIADGEDIIAIYQGVAETAAFIRVGIGGQPDMPEQLVPPPKPARSDESSQLPAQDWWPDEEW